MRYFAGVGTVPDMALDGPVGAVSVVVVLPVAPSEPLTFGVVPVVVAPAGALVAGVGALESELGAGGDCIDPACANAGPAARSKAKANA